jgi:hypothetical protein
MLASIPLGGVRTKPEPTPGTDGDQELTVKLLAVLEATIPVDPEPVPEVIFAVYPAHETDPQGEPLTKTVTLPVPETDVAVPVGKRNSSTLLFPVSTTQRLPVVSKATSEGAVKLLEVVVDEEVVKVDCPITRLALIPFKKGGTYSSTLLLPVSATHRFP